MTTLPACPFCDARDVERIGQWGGQIITAQWRCRACGSYFEALRQDLDDARPSPSEVSAHPPGEIARERPGPRPRADPHALG